MPVDSPNVGVAFGLVCGAGAATALGASVVFFPSLVKLASRRVLAGALGISAGVMTYVSFVEIFQKSTQSFIDAGHDDNRAYAYATLCFFGGVVSMIIMDFLVKWLSGGKHHHHHDHHDHHSQRSESECAHEQEVANPDVLAPHCVGCSDDPVGELEAWQHMATHGQEADDERKEELHTTTAPTTDHTTRTTTCATAALEPHDEVELSTGEVLAPALENEMEEADVDKKQPVSAMEEENRKLVNMGINTALAIGLHNFPEGLATFVAALDDPSVGAVLAIAIGIHNIPEGLCVALPIYYATGNRRKAFLWACVSGISEPIAALLGWAILASSFSDNLYAVLFGIVGGMMVIISVKELLPTAHRYDPQDTVVTYSFIVGMCVMALSLVLFLL